MAGDGERVLLRVPRPQANLLTHIYSQGLPQGVREHPLDPLTFIKPVLPHIFAAFVHELGVDRAVGLVLEVDDVDVGVVGAGEDEVGVGGHLQVELVEDGLALVDLAQLLLQVVRGVEGLAGLLRVAHVPDLHGQVVTRKYVIIINW
jgi:hypothetical protein